MGGIGGVIGGDGSIGVYWGWVRHSGCIGDDGVMKSNGEAVVVTETGDLYTYFITGLYGGMIWECWDVDREC